MKKILLLFLFLLTRNWQMEAQCWQSVATGENHNLALKTDGTLWAWGNNSGSQLGDGTLIAKSTPIQIGTANNWAAISACYTSSVAVKSDGTLWFWGMGNINYNHPIQVGTDNDWSVGIAGFGRCFAIKNNGTLWGWGNNNEGELGDGTYTFRSTPVQIGTASNWATICTGEHQTLALKTDGSLWSWGSEGFGELGNGGILNDDRVAPLQIGTSTDWQSIKCGAQFSIGLKTDGTLWAWGRNNTGQLGDGTTTNRGIPAQVGTDTDWESADAGYFFNYARKTDGTLWTWGSNYFGQLSNGSLTDEYLPVPVTSISAVDVFKAGGFHTLFLKADNSLWASGSNSDGQLGDGESGNGIYEMLPVLTPCVSLYTTDFIGDDSVVIYPNPAKNFVEIKSKTATPINSYTITDVTGKTIVVQNENQSIIDIRNLKSGIYIVKCTRNNEVILKKLIKE